MARTHWTAEHSFEWFHQIYCRGGRGRYWPICLYRYAANVEQKNLLDSLIQHFSASLSWLKWSTNGQFARGEGVGLLGVNLHLRRELKILLFGRALPRIKGWNAKQIWVRIRIESVYCLARPVSRCIYCMTRAAVLSWSKWNWQH